MAFVEQSKVKHLQGLAGNDITESVCVGILMENGNNIERATDDVLTMYLDIEDVQTQIEARKQKLQEMGRTHMTMAKELAEEEARCKAERKQREAAEAEQQRKMLADIEKKTAEERRKLEEDERKLLEFNAFIDKAGQEQLAAEKKRLESEKARVEANKQEEIAEVQRKLNEEKALMQAQFKRQAAENARMRKQVDEQAELLEAQKKQLAEERQRLETLRQETESTKAKELEELKALKKQKEKKKKARSKKKKPAKKAKEADAIDTTGLSEKEVQDIKDFEDTSISDEAPEEAQVPKVMLMLSNGTDPDTPARKKLVDEIVTLLGKYDVEEDDITYVDVSNDAELAGFIHEKVNENKETPTKIEYPHVCIHGRPVGTVTDLQVLAAAGQLRDLLNKEDVDLDVRVSGTGVYVGQGVLDHCLDAAEYVASGVGSMLMLPVTLVSWPFRSGAGNSTPVGIDFDVVHTNWYWRNLKRKFRFCEDSFLRIHPRHNDVRATHAYSTVKTIRYADTTNISIEYEDESATDYITATEEDCSQIVSIIQKHNPAAQVFSLHEL